MSESLSYQIDTAKISVEKMQFTVINNRPNYPLKDRESVRATIEKQLYTVFCKYAGLH